MSVLLFCLVLELRIAVVLWNVQTPYSTCGRFKHVAYMDDTTYVLQDLDEVPKVLANLQQVLRQWSPHIPNQFFRQNTFPSVYVCKVYRPWNRQKHFIQ